MLRLNIGWRRCPGRLVDCRAQAGYQIIILKSLKADTTYLILEIDVLVGLLAVELGLERLEWLMVEE